MNSKTAIRASTWDLKRRRGEELALEGGEEGLGHGVVVGVADTAHRRAHASLLAAESELDRGVLAPLVGVVDDVAGLALLHGELEGVDDQLRAQMGLHGPADDTSAPGIENHGQVEESRPRWGCT
jgi:hypothetical protein